MWYKFTLLYVLLAKTIICGEVGDKCIPNDEESEGSCKLIFDCEVALRAIKESFNHPYTRCGFDKLNEIVCCPIKLHVSHEFEKRVSSKKEITLISDKNLGEEQSKRIADIECQKIVDSSAPPTVHHIIGGVSASMEEFPHMAALWYNTSGEYTFQCGGALISESYILTAAHCMTYDLPIFVRMGVIKIGEPTFNEMTDERVADVILHPSYKKRYQYHDLALIRLEKAVRFSTEVYPICLYTAKDDPATPLTVTGWGRTKYRGDKSDVLLKANVIVVPNNKCRESYGPMRRLPQGITEEQICAGDPKGLHDTCQGDSGGPLQGLTESDGHYRLMGVTSFGRGCGSSVPGVYVRVSHYLDWIESVVWTN